jgi:peptidoglycan/xylan/chitin deacetylase (PgdA/CDA1 family)
MSRRSAERSGPLAVALAAAIATPLAPRLAWAHDQSLVSVQVQSQAPAATQSAAPQPNQDNATQADGNCPGHPGALGTSRVLAIDPAQYRRIGHMQYSDSLPLADKEVVLTFDDGPILPYSNQILDILASQCVKATYFMVGEMARAFPATVRRIYEEGHTIGTHSEHHPTRFGQLPVERMRHEIDRGISDVSAALGDPKISRTVLPYSRSGTIRCRRKGTRRTRVVGFLIRHRRGRLASSVATDHCFGNAASGRAWQGHSAPSRHPSGHRRCPPRSAESA